MRTFDPTTLAADLRPTIDHLRTLSASARNAAGGPYSATFTECVALDCAFVAEGQSDTTVRDELRTLLKKPHVATIAVILLDLVADEAGDRCGDPRAAQPFLYLPGAAGGVGETAGLTPLQTYWLRLVTYCVLVAYGNAGDPLPVLPRCPVQGALPEKDRHARIGLKVIPGDQPRAWYGWDEDDGSGIPDATLTVRR
ncbi:hypothetical protein [Methylorubrum extorquens]|jgi:hypothetical protein|uniref:hypothetical protein n=1 Tax=Methylorubrum extorquens TaxID=408 RepID=UPI00209E9DFB|nr:hypothetical protein [Methylorubrum extorquens]MCP1540178.1 hypothetical protein [Methylorubrum extorquens]